MKKQIHPFPPLNLFIHTNGSTYSYGLWLSNIRQPFSNIFKIDEKNYISIKSESQINPQNFSYVLKKKHKLKIESLFRNFADSPKKESKMICSKETDLQSFCEYANIKIITCNKKNMKHFSDLAFFTLKKIKSFDIDTFSNPFWNGNHNARFGIFEQVSDNALFKFKKRYSSF